MVAIVARSGVADNTSLTAKPCCGYIAAAHMRALLTAVALAALLPASRAQAAEPDSAGIAEWQPGVPYALDASLGLGYAGRLGEPSRFNAVDSGGFTLGGALDLAMARRVTLGLGYEHVDLGREDTGVTSSGFAAIERDLNSLWLRLRLYPVRFDMFAAYLGIAVAGAWQSLDATGTVWPLNEPGRSVSLSCQGAGTVALGLRAAVGAVIPFGEASSLRLGGQISGYGLSDDVIDNCAFGAGSVETVSASMLFAHRFSWGDGPDG